MASQLNSSVHLFFRDGRPAAGCPVNYGAGGKTWVMVAPPCGRCGGTGELHQFRHIEGGVCFECNGRRFLAAREVPVYTAEKIAKLNALAEKKHAKKQAKVEVELAAAVAKADVEREAFEAAHSEVLRFIRTAGRVDDAGVPDGEFRYADGFLGELLQRLHGGLLLTPGQIEGARKFMLARQEADAKRAASRWIGEIGKRIDATVTVERVHHHWRVARVWHPGCNRSGEECVSIVTMRDGAGNALVSKSTSFNPDKGADLRIRATVKEHSQYRDEMQTVLQRIRVLKIEKEGEVT